MTANVQTLVDKLVCENLKALVPYESARRLFAASDNNQDAQVPVWLNANESPFANEYSIDSDLLNRYPDCQPSAVIKPYASYAGVNNKQLLVSRGADEGIELLIRAFCTPGKDSILICPPTYGMYAISAETCNVGVDVALLKPDFSLDIEAIKTFKDKVNIVFICSPNNPTGTSVAPQQIEQVLNHFADSALVVVDEAYIEFDATCTFATKLAEYPNLVILRTLSKAFALAGIRCGFTLANEAIIHTLLKVIAPYPMPQPVAQIAEQALSAKGLALMTLQVETISDEKAKLKQALSNFPGIELVGDDKANFILFRSAQKQALMDFLVSHKMFIRDQSKQRNLANCLRITVGNVEQNQHLLSLIKQFFASQSNTGSPA
ncbi:histidinol-phosphate transaminase [Paraglaciecola hydrolytica]|uniref:Histidinol-phosphate aminotransferase n=1 Tax=Paraglaciecola hydrolytica TaxID=1799789 RepID=A0A148KMC1_9ALTE|nr:histidinol-phosphate transaminase [Paraglaciecola hydrolytica]KXI27409.1 histidinol-phosphate aminotransferase [Paraglaciecola hydrolytica]